MAVLSDLPPELILHTVSLLTRETILDPHYCLPESTFPEVKRELVPDLPSITADLKTIGRLDFRAEYGPAARSSTLTIFGSHLS